MLYQQYEMQRMALAPMRMLATNALGLLDLPNNPLRTTPLGRMTAAWLDSFEHSTRRFGKPRFGHTHTSASAAPRGAGRKKRSCAACPGAISSGSAA